MVFFPRSAVYRMGVPIFAGYLWTLPPVMVCVSCYTYTPGDFSAERAITPVQIDRLHASAYRRPFGNSASPTAACQATRAADPESIAVRCFIGI